MLPLRFVGSVVRGLGIGGSKVRVPTINIDLSCVPDGIPHGVYAGCVRMEGRDLAAAIHYGPRPAVRAGESFEIHVLDEQIDAPPGTVDIELLDRLRDIRDFASLDALRAAIADDVLRVRETFLKRSPQEPEVR